MIFPEELRGELDMLLRACVLCVMYAEETDVAVTVFRKHAIVHCRTGKVTKYCVSMGGRNAICVGWDMMSWHHDIGKRRMINEQLAALRSSALA